MSNDKFEKGQARLFSTLASIEQTDRSATKRRKQSRLQSLQQSRAAADQTKLNGILLELRILTQRCLTEEINATAAVNNGTANGDTRGTLDGTSQAKDEVDALLENLLEARRDLMGHQLRDVDDSMEGDGDDASNEDEKNEVDYAKLIRQVNDEKEQDGTSSSDDEESSTDSDGDSRSGSGEKDNLAKQLQNEYSSLQSHWKSILNKHHSKLALHSGMSVNSSKFQSKAVDVSFWEQVQGGIEHERFKQRASSSNNHQTLDGASSTEHLQFDDSKLYQQMLKDFISSSQTNRSTTSKANKRGIMMDPAQEAAERLKRAMRKKSGGGSIGDVDLTSLLTETGSANLGGMISQTNVMKKKTATVDRRASKGRKIRYAVNPKLVNFTFPVTRAEPMIKEDVWFKSLFGGVGNAR